MQLKTAWAPLLIKTLTVGLSESSCSFHIYHSWRKTELCCSPGQNLLSFPILQDESSVFLTRSPSPSHPIQAKVQLVCSAIPTPHLDLIPVMAHALPTRLLASTDPNFAMIQMPCILILPKISCLFSASLVPKEPLWSILTLHTYCPHLCVSFISQASLPSCHHTVYPCRTKLLWGRALAP